jgi:hypothetical protein
MTTVCTRLTRGIAIAVCVCSCASADSLTADPDATGRADAAAAQTDAAALPDAAPPAFPDAAPPAFPDAAAGADAATTSIDAALAPDAAICAGEGAGTCASPVELGCAGGFVFASTTCGAGDHVGLSCATPPGTEDVAISVCGAWAPFEISPGFVYEIIVGADADCAGTVAACGLGFGIDSSCDSGESFLVVEKLDGGCGAFEVTFAPL